jgi:hypothetical protein
MEYKGNYAFINIKNEKKKSIKFQKIATKENFGYIQEIEAQFKFE